jgi:DNA-directed RNA polymerase subunit alpha
MLKKKGEGVVTAADISETDQVQVINKDLHIATLDNKTSDFDLELIVEQGRGYVPVEARENQKLEVGMLSIDAIYSPVKSVYFDVTNVRVGQITNYDKLEMHMETDGTISGSDAINMASHILVDHFTMLFAEGSSPVALAAENGESPLHEPEMEQDEEPVLDTAGLDELNLSNRAKNALVKHGITTVASLKGLSNDEINNIDGLGKKTITEILAALGRE